jgi:hypothetical protein
VLCTIEQVLNMPGLQNQAAIPLAWLNDLLGEADAGIKLWCKRALELSAYTEFHSGDQTRDIILRQWPCLVGNTQVAAGSNGAVLPQATVNVVSTSGFHQGTGSDPSQALPSVALQTGVSTYSVITYTGTTATSFTGCSGGTGTLSSATGLNNCFSPCVFFDPGGYWGQAPSAFAPGTLLVLGVQVVVDTDDSQGKISERGLLRRIGGSGAGFVGFYPENFYSGKLGAYRLPMWPRGDGNLKVLYSAGHQLGKIPLPLQNACKQLVAWMARNNPAGAPLASESLGGYSYSVLGQGEAIPEIGSICRILARYREPSW